MDQRWPGAWLGAQVGGMDVIDLPDPSRAFDHENAFYLTCAPSRIGKLLAQYELFKSVVGLPGAIVECGVFKGASFARFAMFADLFTRGRKLIGFDTFGAYPESNDADAAERAAFIAEAGSQSIGVDQLAATSAAAATPGAIMRRERRMGDAMGKAAIDVGQARRRKGAA